MTVDANRVSDDLAAAIQRLIGRGNALVGYLDAPEAIAAGAADAYSDWQREADAAIALALSALAPSPQPVAEAVAWRWNWGAGGRWFYDEERPNDADARSPYHGKLTTVQPLFTSPPDEGLGVEVKPLEWRDDQWPRDAAALGLLFRVYGGRPDGRFKLVASGKPDTFHETVAAAKAAAQADFAARILSSLQPKE